MIKICVKINGWKRHKLHKIISFPDSMFKELKQAEKCGMIGIIPKIPKASEYKPKVTGKYKVKVKEGDNNGT